MKINFTEAELMNESNKFEIEEDDVMVMAEYIEGEGKNFIITGSAVIEGETYHDFQVEVELSEEIDNPTGENIISAQWEWYDYIC